MKHGIQDTALLSCFKMKRRLKRTASARVHSLGQQFGTRVAFWKKLKESIPKAVLTFGWNRVTTSFLPLGPSSIKHLLPSGEKSTLNRTTRLHSSTNSFKCAKLYDCYEYGLENSNQSLTNTQRSNVEICLHAFSAIES